PPVEQASHVPPLASGPPRNASAPQPAGMGTGAASEKVPSAKPARNGSTPKVYVGSDAVGGVHSYHGLAMRRSAALATPITFGAATMRRAVVGPVVPSGSTSRLRIVPSRRSTTSTPLCHAGCARRLQPTKPNRPSALKLTEVPTWAG